MLRRLQAIDMSFCPGRHDDFSPRQLGRRLHAAARACCRCVSPAMRRRARISLANSADMSAGAARQVRRCRIWGGEMTMLLRCKARGRHSVRRFRPASRQPPPTRRADTCHIGFRAIFMLRARRARRSIPITEARRGGSFITTSRCVAEHARPIAIARLWPGLQSSSHHLARAASFSPGQYFTGVFSSSP